MSSIPTRLPMLLVLLAVGFTSAKGAEPVLIAATTLDEHRVELQWTGDAGGWQLEHSPDRRAWQMVAELTSGSQSLIADGLPAGQLVCFRLRQDESVGNWLYAVTDEAVSAAARPIAPVARWTGDDSVVLRWQDPFSDETGWQIQRQTDGAFATVAEVDADSTQWSESGLDSGVRTTYRLRAMTASGDSAWSLEVPALVDDDYNWYQSPSSGNESVQAVHATLNSSLTPPDQLAVLASGPTWVELQWRDRSADENGFSIQHSWDGERYLECDRVPADTTNWRHDGVVLPGRQRWYRVVALDSSNQRSPWTTPLAVTPPTGQASLGTPPQPTVTELPDDAVRLDWSPPPNGLSAIIVERSTESDPRYEELTTLDPTATSYTDDDARGHLRWRLRWQDGSDYSSAGAGAYLPADGLRDALAAPTLADAADGVVRVSWAAISDYNNGYVIERSPAGADDWARVGWVTDAETSWDDRSAVPAAAYDYRVTPTGYILKWATGASARITVAAPSATPTPPDQLQATGVATDAIALTWRNRSPAVDQLAVQRKATGGGNFTTIASLPIGCQSWTDHPPASGDWTYRLQVTNDAGSAESASSDASTTTMDPGASATIADSAMGQRVLVSGSAAGDTVVIAGDADGLTVDIDGTRALDLSDPPSRVQVRGAGGDDRIEVDCAAGLRLEIWTGTGSDTVTVAGSARVTVIAVGGGSDALTDAASVGTTLWCDAADTVTTTSSTVLRRVTSCHQPWSQDPTASDHVPAEPDGRRWDDPGNWTDNQSEQFPGPDLWGPLGPVAFDVTQGFQQICGDTSFYAAIADQRPRFIEDLLCDLGDGTYLYRFGAAEDPGSWARYDLDATGFFYSVPGPAGGLWWLMLEKAIFAFGLPYAPETDLDTRVVDLQQPAEDLLALLQTELDAGAAITVRTIGSGVADAPFVRQGHAYSVLGLYRVADGSARIILRNPYGIGRRSTFNSPFVRHWRYQGLITVTVDGLQGNCAYAFSTRLPAAPDPAPVNRAPTIDQASADPSTVTTTSGELQVSASDADEDPLQYRWTLVDAPTGASPQIGDDRAATTMVSFDQTGAYRFRIRVSDPDGAVAETTVDVSVVATASSMDILP